jgi:anti-sigma-K factor RskA
MNIVEYVESGIIELYAMNALSPNEKKEFERLMVLYPEIGRELNKTKAVLEQYAAGHSMNPRPQLRQEIIANIQGDQKDDKQKGKSRTGDYSLTYKYMIAASLAALVVSTFASWFFYSRWDEAEERYTKLLNEKNDLSQNYNLLKSTFDESVSNLVIMRDESSDVYVLHSKDTMQRFQARVYWSKYSRRSFLDIISVSPPGDGKQFQLWAISGRDTFDAGVFSPGEPLQRMKDIPRVDSWFITIEPKGGSLSPNKLQVFMLSGK